jgi:uncharacterized protein
MNQKLADLLVGHINLYPHRLEKEHPHVVERIAEIWGSRELDAYFESLILDERCSRNGFAPPVMGEIFLLRNYCLEQQPPPPRTANTWGQLTEVGEVRLERETG